MLVIRASPSLRGRLNEAHSDEGAVGKHHQETEPGASAEVAPGYKKNKLIKTPSK
jgi:hypothetical protein